MNDKMNLSKCLKPNCATWKNTPHLPGLGRKFSSLKHPCSTGSICYNSNAIYSTVQTQTKTKHNPQTHHVDFSLSWETTLLLTVSFPVIPLTVGLGENQTKKSWKQPCNRISCILSRQQSCIYQILKNPN